MICACKASSRLCLQVYRAVLDTSAHVAVKKLNKLDMESAQFESFAKEVAFAHSCRCCLSLACCSCCASHALRDALK